MANLGASMFVRDLNGDEYMMEGEVKHSQEINGDERIDVEIEYTDVNAHFLNKNSDLKMWILGFEGKEYRIISSTIKGHGNKYTVSVTGILYMLDWLNSNRIYQRIDASLTTVEAMNLIFDDSPFTYQITAQAPSKRFEGLGDGETRLEMLKKFIEGYGFEITILGNVMYFQALIGNDTNFQYEYKVNATDITQETDASEMFTYAEGYGNYPDDDESAVSKAKLKRSYVSPLESIVGDRRHAPPIKDGRITIKETMDAALKKLVDDSLQISFSANLNDLKHRGYKYEHAKLGDRIFLVDKRIGLDTEIRVVKIDRSYSQEYELKDISITFGSKNMADTYTSNFSSAISNINDVMAGRKAIPFEALGIVAQSMVSKIQNTSSELTFDINGIHAIDKNDANNIVTLNSSGMYLSTDGGRTGKTAITAEGIVADTITTGHLDTSLVTIRNSDSDNYIEMRNDIIMSRGRFTRRWANITDTATLNLGIRKGHIMVSNEDTGYNLYITEKGLSTMLNGASDETAGTIEFHSQRFNESSRGVTVHSTYGAVALLSEQSRIYTRANLTNNIESSMYGVYVRPYMTTREGLNEFNFYVKENESAQYTDGCLLYGNLTDTSGIHGSGIRFSKSSTDRVVYATDYEGNIGTGDFYADKLYGDWKSKSTNLYAMTAYDGELRVTDKKGYNNGDMTFRPIAAKSFNQVSSLKYKTNIENVDDIGLSTINDLTVVKYSLKSDVENGDNDTKQLGFIAEYSESIATSEKTAIDMYKLLSYNTKAIQELYRKFVEQQKQLEALQNG